MTTLEAWTLWGAPASGKSLVVAGDLIPPRDRGFAAMKRDGWVSVGRPARRVGHSLMVAETGRLPWPTIRPYCVIM
jgi:hypothetical protein